jgi:WD40 repeat protein
MTGHDDFDRTLADWFDADALSPAPAGGLDRVIDASRRRRPRPAWLADLGSHWVGETQHAGSSSGVRSLPRLGVRWSTALILLLTIAAVVGGAILVGALVFKPSPFPTGRLGHLAYGLDGDIYLADWDGKKPVRIAHALPADPAAGCGTFWGEGPMWAPDGGHLTYRSDCGTVYISDPASHVVASFPGTGWLVSWSPDSTRVATWVELTKTIGIYGLDGVRQALLTLPPGQSVGGDYDPVWSADGKSLLIPLVPPRPSQVWELPLDDRPPRLLPADDPRSRWLIATSPDRARVAYVGERKLPEPFVLTGQALVVAAADGSQDTVVVSSGARLGGQNYAIWSPSGDRIAFAWSGYAPEPAVFADELRIVDLTSGTVTRLATNAGTDSLSLIRFSPDGDRILYSRTNSTGTVGSLWTVRADGSDPRLLVTGTGWGDWQWQPPGS